MNRLTSSRLLAFCLVVGTTLTLPLSAQKWARYGPGTRSQASSVYDPATNQMFVFGGQHAPTNIDFNDLWSVQNVIPSSASAAENLQWIRVTVTGKGPNDRFGQSSVYNTASDRMIVFGGGGGFPGPCLNDLWVVTHLNGVGGKPTWKQFAATGTLPPVREGHTAVYDQAANKMIIFGGTDCNGNYYNDLWILNNADGSTVTPSWTQVTPIGTGPSARTQATAIYDSVNSVMTVFAGGNTGTTVYNDVWTLTNANGLGGTPTWTQLTPKGTAPAARVGHGAIYDSTNNRMTIFGGGNVKGKVVDDGWVLTYPNNIGGTPAWTQLKFTDAAPYRKSFASMYDPVSDTMVIFGGDSQIAQTFTDDHVLTLSEANGLGSAGLTWTQDGPPARYYTSDVYDVARDQMIVFGGLQTTGVPLNDVWSVTGIVSAGQTVTTTPYDFVQIFPTGTPPAARYGHAAEYDSVSNRMILFGGGVSATSCLNDLWLLDTANSVGGTPAWVQETASGTPPPARLNFVSQYDTSSNTVVIFGGSNCAGGYLSDVWVLSNANGNGGTPTWTQLTPAGVGPTARENASAIYDSTNHVLTLFAGDAGGAGLSDVWSLSNANGEGGTPTWTHIVPTGTAPSARTGQSSVYDSVNNRMIMYGGVATLAGTIPLGDTWILTFANNIGGTPAWISEKVTGTAPTIRFHSAFYSSSYNNMVIFGGENQITGATVQDRTFILSVANDL